MSSFDPKTTLNFKKREGYTRRDVFFVPVDDIRREAGFNHRTIDLENDEDLRQYIEELADSIADFGMLDAMLVRKDPGNPEQPLVLRDGECRWLALQLLKRRGLDIKAKVEITTEADQAKMLIESATKNMQRRGLKFSEEATVVRRLYNYGYSDDEIAKSLSKSITWVRARHEIAGATTEVRQAVADKKITQKTACDIAKTVSAEEQKAVLDEILSQGEGRRHKATRAAEEVLAKRGKVRTLRPTKSKLESLVDLLKNQEDLGNKLVSAANAHRLVVMALEYAAGSTSEAELAEAVRSYLFGANETRIVKKTISIKKPPARPKIPKESAEEMVESLIG